MKEGISWKSQWRLDRFKDPKGKIARALRRGLSIQEAITLFSSEYLGFEEWQGNLGLQEGRAELIDIICGLGTPTKWDATNARLGVGDSNAAPAETQTGLQAATNKDWHAMDSTYPARSAQTAEWRATYGDGHAQYAWEEYTVVNAADDTGKNLNRCIASKGTKPSGESWTLSLKITFNAS